MERWAGRVAVVTGASAGIGAAIALELVKKGLIVVGLARRVQPIEAVIRTLKPGDGQLYPLKCDIRNESDIQEAFSWVKTKLGRLDILVNNAGCFTNHTLTDGPEETWRQIIDLDVLGLSICTKEALQIMKEKGVNDGHIIHINSFLGHTLPPAELGLTMYSAAKHAVTALTEGLRRELVNSKSKIRVTSLSPGLVKTGSVPEDLLKVLPYLVPQDLADAVVYILGTPPHVQIHELTMTAIFAP